MNPFKKKIVIIVLVGFAVGGTLFLLKNKMTSQTQGTSSQKKDIYYCPMHPTYTSDRPGTCPICNMNLVKKEEAPSGGQAGQPTTKKQDICVMHNCPHMKDGKPCPMLVVGKEGEAIDCPVCKKRLSSENSEVMPAAKVSPEGYAAILLTPQKQQMIGLKTAPVQKKKIAKSIRAVGTVAHDPELYQAQVEFIEAISAYKRAAESSLPEIADGAKRLVDATRIRLKHFGLSEAMIDEIAIWKEAEHGLLFAHPGDPVWMYAQIYEYELPLVKIGQEVLVDVPALPNEKFQGAIRAIDAMVDATTRTTRIRAQLQDLQGHLKPDMYVNATINVDLGEVLTVPLEAVFSTGTRQIVFVDKGQGLLEPRDVVLGAKADNDYEIKKGLSAGEMVVTSGNFLIDSESRLKAALEGMSSGGGHSHGQ